MRQTEQDYEFFNWFLVVRLTSRKRNKEIVRSYEDKLGILQDLPGILSCIGERSIPSIVELV